MPFYINQMPVNKGLAQHIKLTWQMNASFYTKSSVKIGKKKKGEKRDLCTTKYRTMAIGKS